MDFSFIKSLILNFFLNQTKTAQSKSETKALATRNFNSINTKQYPNPYGPKEFSYGVQSSIPTWKSSSAFNSRLSDIFLKHKQPQDQ
jgi:hypothetical protein